MDGMTAVCPACGRVYFLAAGHACRRGSSGPAGTSAQGGRSLVPAATLPDGTPHPDPFLAERGWVARDGVYVRVPGGGDGEEAVA
jgi:hypothetical protein